MATPHLQDVAERAEAGRRCTGAGRPRNSFSICDVGGACGKDSSCRILACSSAISRQAFVRQATFSTRRSEPAALAQRASMRASEVTNRARRCGSAGQPACGLWLSVSEGGRSFQKILTEAVVALGGAVCHRQHGASDRRTVDQAHHRCCSVYALAETCRPRKARLCAEESAATR